METPDLIGKLDELIAQHADELERLKAARALVAGAEKPNMGAAYTPPAAKKVDANGLTSGQRAARTRRYRKAGRKAAETRRRNAANARAKATAAVPDAHDAAILEEEARAKAAGEVPEWAA